MAVLLFEQPEGHNPQRPSWSCGTCGNEWPCANARADLIAESIDGRTPVLVYLTMCLAGAVVDLSSGGFPPDLYDRFVGWTDVDLDRARIGSTKGVNSR